MGMPKTKEKRRVAKKEPLASTWVMPRSGVCSLLPLSHFLGGAEIFLSLISCFVLCCPLVNQKLLSTRLLDVDGIVLVNAFSEGVRIPVRDWVPK